MHYAAVLRGTHTLTDPPSKHEERTYFIFQTLGMICSKQLKTDAEYTDEQLLEYLPPVRGGEYTTVSARAIGAWPVIPD